MIENEIKSHHVIRASGNYYSVLKYQIIHLKLIQYQLKQSAFNEIVGLFLNFQL